MIEAISWLETEETIDGLADLWQLAEGVQEADKQ